MCYDIDVKPTVRLQTQLEVNNEKNNENKRRYIQKRVSTLHQQKSELDKKMQTMCRKRKAIDTKPLEEPMKQWDKLTVQEKHDVAAAMIDVVLISDETGIEVKFSI